MSTAARERIRQIEAVAQAAGIYGWSAVITSGRWDIVENWLGLLSVDDSGTRLQEMQAAHLGGNERDE